MYVRPTIIIRTMNELTDKQIKQTIIELNYAFTMHLRTEEYEQADEVHAIICQLMEQLMKTEL